jgi:predicted neuraminidase
VLIDDFILSTGIVMLRRYRFTWVLVLSLAAKRVVCAEDAVFRAELIFPLNDQHNHAPGIVQSEAGDLIVSWYRGSGERRADDVAVYGARRRAGENEWSEPFLMADTPGFPDCNTCMWIDPERRLWLFWPTILANTWESCLTNYCAAEQYEADGAPRWSRRGLILLKPEDFSERAVALLDEALKRWPEPLLPEQRAELEQFREKIGDKLFQRLGWQPRCKPIQLPSGRIVLPLYTDTFSISIMALSDDGGATWRASRPLIGFGNIQPTLLRRSNGTLVAYMRENGPLGRIRVAQSQDEGETWGPVGTIELPNPGAGIDAAQLPSGHWVMVYNDSTENRQSLAVAVSKDEGETWETHRHLERQTDGAYHYPAIVAGQDGLIHVVYSYFVEDGKSMKHAEFNLAWAEGE